MRGVDADAVIQQFYPGDLGGLALAEVVFGDVNPSGKAFSILSELRVLIVWVGKLPVSFPRSVGTAPAFYNYLKGARPLDPGGVYDNGTLHFGHQVRLRN
jgi:beta-glucosidase